jgi:hypothetical protein
MLVDKKMARIRSSAENYNEPMNRRVFKACGGMPADARRIFSGQKQV